MKLHVRYNRYNILFTTIIFIVGSGVFYFLLQYILIRQVDDTLKTEQQEVIQYQKYHNALPEIVPTKHQYTSYEETDKLAPVTYKTITIYKKGDGDNYRQIQFGIEAGGQDYLVTVRKPLEETEHLLEMIIAITVAMVACILITSYFINRFVLARLWKPFYQTMGRIQEYSLSSQAAISTEQTDIDEFALLNESVAGMTSRLQKDYRSLKEFTSHAAHEMQTPLAVIRGKLDMLVQQETILQNDGSNIADIERAVSRLSRLNQSLLLLTKVENRQFVLGEMTSINELLSDKISELHEMFVVKHLTVNMDVKPCMVRFHRHLAEIVISNLLHNAIRYNKDAGIIDVVLNDHTLIIANTSELAALPEDKVFQKFYRHSNAKEDGNGLGLSIVKQICDMAGYTINYEYKDNKHIFSILFSGNH